MDPLNIQQHENTLLEQNAAMGFVVQSGDQVELREYKSRMGYIWLSILTTIQSWRGATVESYSDARAVARAKQTFNQRLEDLRSGDRTRILNALEECQELRDAETDYSGKLRSIYVVGNSRIYGALTHLAYRTGDVAEILFGRVIQQRAPGLLVPTYRSDLPEDSKKLAVLGAMSNPEAAAQAEGNPIAVGIAYLLQTEGRAGELFQGLRTIDLQEEFSTYLSRLYNESDVGRKAAEAEETLKQYSELQAQAQGEKNREARDRFVQELQKIGADLERQAGELADLCKSSTLAQELTTIEEGLGRLATPVITQAWSGAKTAIVNRHRELQRSIASLKEAMEKKSDQAKTVDGNYVADLTQLREESPSFEAVLSTIPQQKEAASWVPFASFLPFSSAPAPTLEERYQSFQDRLKGGVISQEVIGLAQEFYGIVDAEIKRIEEEESVSFFESEIERLKEDKEESVRRIQGLESQKQVELGRRMLKGETATILDMAQEEELNRRIEANREEIQRCEDQIKENQSLISSRRKKIFQLQQFATWLEKFAVTGMGGNMIKKRYVTLQLTTSHLTSYHNSLAAVNQLFDPTLGV